MIGKERLLSGRNGFCRKAKPEKETIRIKKEALTKRGSRQESSCRPEHEKVQKVYVDNLSCLIITIQSIYD